MSLLLKYLTPQIVAQALLSWCSKEVCQEPQTARQVVLEMCTALNLCACVGSASLLKGPLCTVSFPDSVLNDLYNGAEFSVTCIVGSMGYDENIATSSEMYELSIFMPIR